MSRVRPLFVFALQIKKKWWQKKETLILHFALSDSGFFAALSLLSISSPRLSPSGCLSAGHYAARMQSPLKSGTTKTNKLFKCINIYMPSPLLSSLPCGCLAKMMKLLCSCVSVYFSFSAQKRTIFMYDSVWTHTHTHPNKHYELPNFREHKKRWMNNRDDTEEKRVLCCYLHNIMRSTFFFSLFHHRMHHSCHEHIKDTENHRTHREYSIDDRWLISFNSLYKWRFFSARPTDWLFDLIVALMFCLSIDFNFVLVSGQQGYKWSATGFEGSRRQVNKTVAKKSEMKVV